MEIEQIWTNQTKERTVQMSEKEKQIEKERKAVLQLLLEKTGLKYKELVDAQIGMWMAGNLDLLSAEEKKQFPHLVFWTIAMTQKVKLLLGAQIIKPTKVRTIAR